MDGSIFHRFFSTILDAALAASVLACAGASAFAEGEINMIEIDRMTVGTPPAGFSFARTGRGSDGEWIVIADPTAKAGLAIEQTSTDATDYRFPLAIHASLSVKNLKAEIRFKAVAGKIDRAAGIAVRVEGPDNYYVARANALEDNVRFYRVVTGKRQQLGTANIRITSGEWHTLTLEARDQRFAVTYDGSMLFEVADNTFTEAGAVALWTKADSVTRFDSMTITPLP
jgi:Galactocerebrosidase, C-terminal lectin domain